MELKLIKKLLITENVFGIYRQYSSLERDKIKALHILFVVVMQVLFLNIIYPFTASTLQTQKVSVISIILCAQTMPYFYLNVTLILSFKSRKSFNLFLKNINEAHNNYECEESYIKFLRNINIKCAIMLVIYIGIRISMIILKFEDWRSFAREDVNASLVILTLSETWMDNAYFFEQIVFYILSRILCQLQKLFNSSITMVDKDIQVSLGRGKRVVGVGLLRIGIDKGMISQWVSMYKYLVDCSLHLAECFRFQIFLALSYTVIHFIFTLYRLLNIAIADEKYEYFPAKNLLFILFANMAVVLLIVVPGQRMQNQSAALGQVLSRIYAKLTIDPAYYTPEIKLLKDFKRIVSTNPMEIRILSLPVGMYILPMVLSITATHVIVALQFNHVV